MEPKRLTPHRSTSHPTACPEEAGRILILGLGLLFFTLCVLAMSMGAAQLYLEHKRLQALADAAAAAAASEIDQQAYLAHGAPLGQEIALDLAGGGARAQAVLDGADPQETKGLEQITLRQITPRGPYALTVSLQARATVDVLPAFLQPLVPINLQAEATSGAAPTRLS